MAIKLSMLQSSCHRRFGNIIMFSRMCSSSNQFTSKGRFPYSEHGNDIYSSVLHLLRLSFNVNYCEYLLEFIWAKLCYIISKGRLYRVIVLNEHKLTVCYMPMSTLDLYK